MSRPPELSSRELYNRARQIADTGDIIPNKGGWYKYRLPDFDLRVAWRTRSGVTEYIVRHPRWSYTVHCWNVITEVKEIRGDPMEIAHTFTLMEIMYGN